MLQASSEARLDTLLTSFLRLVTTLNSYRKFLNAADRQSVERELSELVAEVGMELSVVADALDEHAAPART